MKNAGREDLRAKGNGQTSSSVFQRSTKTPQQEEKRKDKKAGPNPTNSHPRSWAAPGAHSWGLHIYGTYTQLLNRCFGGALSNTIVKLFGALVEWSS